MENVFTPGTRIDYATIGEMHMTRSYFETLFETEVDMSIKKRLKRLWTLLTTEKVFDEHGSLGRRSMVRRAPRG
jgi:hypothetical protein